MLPGFPKIRRHRIEDNAALIKHVARLVSPMIGELKRHVQFEGTGNTIERHDETSTTTNMLPVSATLSVPSDTRLADFTPRKHREYLVDAGRQMGQGAAKQLFAELDTQLTAAGQVVDAGGRPLSEDLILETLDRMHHDFTDDGQWLAPTIVMGNEVNPQAPSESFNRRLGELLSRKRDDFRRREADRDLAG